MLGLAIVITGGLQIAFPYMWISLPAQGRVVGRVNNAGIEDVVAVAAWTLKGWEGANVKQLQVLEATSGQDGRFTLAGWGPRFRIGQGRIREEAPDVWIFHQGYLPLRTRNAAAGYGDAGTLLRTRLPVLVLSRPSSAAEYSHAIDELTAELIREFSSSPCSYRHIPRMMMAIQDAREDLAKQGQRPAAAFGDAPNLCDHPR